MFTTYTYTVHPILFVLQDAAAPRTITRGVEERRHWMSVDSSLTSKSINSSLVSKTVDGGLPSKSSMESDLNHMRYFFFLSCFKLNVSHSWYPQHDQHQDNHLCSLFRFTKGKQLSWHQYHSINRETHPGQSCELHAAKKLFTEIGKIFSAE